MKYFSIFVLFFAVLLFVLADDDAKATLDPDPCKQPMLRGRCRALIPRFYYNAETNECKNFKYGGCGGNDNNFATKDDCEAKCKK